MRVIRTVDFETTGTTVPPGQVVEVGFSDLIQGELYGDWRVSAPVSGLCGVDRITPETRAVHHISPAEVEGLPPFDPAAFMEKAKQDGVVALAAHHADFEEKWLGPVLGDMPIICTYKAALRVWPDAPEHKNQCLRYWLEEQGLSKPEAALCQPAHRAGPDAYATAFLLRALIKSPATVEQLIAWTKEPAALPRCPIGKFRGMKWAEVEAGFLGWMVKQMDMSPDLKWNAQRELTRRIA